MLTRYFPSKNQVLCILNQFSVHMYYEYIASLIGYSGFISCEWLFHSLEVDTHTNTQMTSQTKANYHVRSCGIEALCGVEIVKLNDP